VSMSKQDYNLKALRELIKAQQEQERSPAEIRAQIDIFQDSMPFTDSPSEYYSMTVDPDTGGVSTERRRYFTRCDACQKDLQISGKKGRPKIRRFDCCGRLCSECIKERGESGCCSDCGKIFCGYHVTIYEDGTALCDECREARELGIFGILIKRLLKL